MQAQGMVAIVQGLRDAGLTVTLIGDRRARKLATLKQSSLPPARSSVETSTKGVTAAATVSCVDTAAQICDGRYTSSYQLAHCMARPSSPPVRLAEFPPQRTEPSRTQGYFKVGGLSSGEIHPALQIPTHREDYLRNSCTNDDRGSLSKRQSSRETQEFVHSLRKYPGLSPNRSVSSELVQRLIVYTQAKNITKRSYSKSTRSLGNRNADPLKEANPMTKVSKSVQTYTRAKRRKENVPPEKDRDVRKNEDRDVGSCSKKCRTCSPYNMTRNNRNIHISATYDYLKIPPHRHFAAADVRYLTDVTRCLRDTLRQICDDRPVVCPNIQSRYSQHRRQHHRDGVGLQSVLNTFQQSSASNNVGASASLPMAFTGVPAMSSCEAIPGTYQQTYSKAIKICCRCRKPVPCACGHSSSSVRVQRYPYPKDGNQSSPKNASLESNYIKSTSKDKSASGNLDASLFIRDSELEEQVFDWLKEIPVYANEKLEDKATRENMARHLINELKALQGSNDFDQEARKEIAKCVDNMPMWFPENKEVQDIFRAQIVENLSVKLSDVNKTKNRFTEEIVQWVDGLDFESKDDGGQLIKKQDVVDNLIKKLKLIALNSQPDTKEYKEALMAEIVNALNELPLKINGDKVTKLNILADNLASRLSKIPTKYASLEQQVNLEEQLLQKEIWEWLKDIPQFTNSSTLNVIENQKNVEFLAQTLQELHAKGVDNLETQEQMQNAINEWLENNIEDKNQIVLGEKRYLVDNLIRKLLKLEKGISRDKREKSSSTTPSNKLKIIRDWMQDMPDLMSTDEEKNQEIVEKFAQKLEEFQSLNENDTSLEREIFNCLTSMLDKKGKRLHTRDQNDLVRELIARLKTAVEVEAIVEADKHVIQDIIDCFRDIPEIDMNLEVNKKMAEQLAREVQTLQTEEQKESGEKKIKDTVVDWLTEITADSGYKLSTTAQNQLVQKLMSIATATHKPRRRWSKLNDSQKVKKSLREEVCYVLDKSGTDFDDQEEMVSILTDILVDQVMRGESDSETRNRIMNVLKASYTTHEQSEGIASRLIKIGKEMSLSFKTQDSTLKFKDMSERISVLLPQQKVTFQESAQQEILDFIEKLLDGGSIVSVEKLKEATRELAEKIGDIVSMQGTILDHTHKRACVEDEILKYLQNLSLQTGVVREQQASLLADRLQNLAIKTSTPKRTSFENVISFRPRRDSTGSPISTINDISQHMHTQAIENEEQHYLNQLLNIIDDWMNNLPIDLESDEGKSFKDVMVRDLAGDIVDRQKYLQLNSGAKTSEGEELEHLKYQVFRWLNKLPDVKSLLPSISKADHLMDRIKSLSVPQLRKSPERSRQLYRNNNINNLFEDLAMLRIEILKWIEAVPDKFYAVPDKKHQSKLVEDLAEQIHYLHRDGTLTESVFDEVSSQWLLKILKEYNDHYFNSLIEGLKGLLVSKKLITLEISNVMEETSHDIQDKLNSVILNWLKKQALYRRRNSKEKREQERIVAEMSNNLREALKLVHSSQGQRDIMLLNEIKIHIKQFPMDAHLKFDDEFHSTVAVELLEYLKFLQMIHEDSEKHSQALFDLIFNTIKEWTNSLPLQVRKTSAANKELEDLKREFAKTIQNVHEQHPSPTEFRDKNITEEIKKYWHAFPIEPAKKKDQNFTSKKVNDLHAKLIALGNLKQEKDLPFENVTIHTIILKWTENLLWQPKNRIEKSQIDQLATKIDEIIANVLPNNYNSIRSNLEKEIKTFVARLPLQNNKLKENQIRELINNITEFYKCNLSEDHSIANTSPKLQTKYTDDSVNLKPGFKKAADVLYENIENWCDNLPLQEGSTAEEKERVKTLKQNIASKLINVIGDLNMKPEIFNDDSLYEDLLNDEVDNLLSTLPLNPMLERNIPALKENLVAKVKEVRQKTQDELAGQVYKQQLREAISRNLPSVENLTLEEQAPFEVLKDNVADAYVELHYAANNDGMKTKLRNRISNEINNFCDDYLKRYPASPIDPGKLNRELYGVLQKIPIPKDETIKSQVEQVRIKDKINNWIKELPLKKEVNPSEKLQRKKIVAIMAKDLHDIEKEKESNPHIDVGYLMKKEIKKWIKKLPIQPNQESNVEQMIEKLVSKLISTEKSRELSNSYITHNANFVEQENANPSSIKTLALSTYVPHLPPSTLSTDDRAHLQRIRERNQQKQTNCMPSYSPRQYKDASVSPIPIDTGSQADLEETQWQTTNEKTTQSCECSPMHGTKSIQSQSSPYNQSPIPQSSKRREYPVPDQAISPQVEVREYYWDSTNESQAQDPSVIPYAVSEQQGYAKKTLPGYQPPNQTYRNQSPANQSGRPLISQQSPSPPQKFVTSSDRMGPFVTPQSSPHRQTQCAPRMTTPVESSQPFMTSQPPFTTSDRPLELCGPQLPRTPCPHQSTMQSSQRSMPQPNMASCQPDKSFNVPQQPIQTPCMAEPNSATPAPPHQSPRRIPPFVSQETPREERRRGTSKPYFASREISGTSSPFDTDIPEAENRTRVTRLGSLDDVPYTKTCGSQSPKPKRSRASPNEDSDWTIRFPEDTGFWGTPCPRRRPYRTPRREGSYVKENERKEEKMRCRCQERTRTKCMGRRPETCHQSHNHPIQPDFMNQCPKCCGVHCPHPSYLFFR